MAEAQSEKILPRREPFSSLLKALLKKVLLSEDGEKGTAPGRMLMSEVAIALVFGDTNESTLEARA